ncbi:hypothetical protein DXG03_002118 [Asterophora parasitica]|uniref:Uncharacterized protein n=1 Tax=Asterophora parasitica TaxID=117018 RepID=A0A9P7G377_9AGAR|nr:hypothetical protein DXG03_002118 [Asterophora parasitica]
MRQKLSKPMTLLKKACRYAGVPRKRESRTDRQARTAVARAAQASSTSSLPSRSYDDGYTPSDKENDSYAYNETIGLLQKERKRGDHFKKDRDRQAKKRSIGMGSFKSSRRLHGPRGGREAKVKLLAAAVGSYLNKRHEATPQESSGAVIDPAEDVDTDTECTIEDLQAYDEEYDSEDDYYQ